MPETFKLEVTDNDLWGLSSVLKYFIDFESDDPNDDKNTAWAIKMRKKIDKLRADKYPL